MRPPGMAELCQMVAIWWLVLMVSLPSTLNTQILDRAKMTPCKFNPFCLCSNNGEKLSFLVLWVETKGLQALHHRPNTHLTKGRLGTFVRSAIE